MKRPSIGDVARMAGVSTATVSRALNAPETVVEETRAKVDAAVKALSYVRSESAFNFKTQRAHAALVIAHDLGNIYYSELFRGVQRRAGEAGYSIIISPPGPEGAAGLIAAQLRSRKVDGVIVLSAHLASEAEERDLRTLFGGVVPLVRLSEDIGAFAGTQVVIDNEKAGHMAGRHLIEMGHRRLGHILGPDDMSVTRVRRAGFARAIAEAGLSLDERHVFAGGFSAELGREAARAFLALEHRPSAVFAANDEAAMGFISAIARAGLSVPRDVSVIGFDDIALSDAYVPPLTTIHQPRDRIGREAMDLLLRLIARDPGAADAVTELPVHLVVRESVARHG